MIKNKKGFTLIEILAAVTILGILSAIAIVAVNKVIQNAKDNHYKTAQENLMLAGQSYAQNNRSVLPKVIGQKTKVYLSTLQENNYIKEVLDYSDNECSKTESYVQIYKYSQTDYTYFPVLKCPNYNTNTTSASLRPTITIELEGAQTNAKASIHIEDDNKLMSYSYIIYKGTKEMYNSGNIMINNNLKEVDKTVKLSSYTPGTVKLVVTATNIYGNTKTKTVSSDFKDTKSPVCDIKDEDKNDKPWLVSSDAQRTITVGCDDGEGGSGCTKTEYTKVFNTTTRKGIITISDESGNRTDCEVTVNIDNQKPTIKVSVYKAKGKEENTTKTGGAIAEQTFTANGALDLSTVTSTGWFNGNDYPDGIYIEAKLTDDLALNQVYTMKNPTWLKTSDESAATIEHSKSDGNGAKELNQSVFGTIDGYRFFKFFARDEAGNETIVTVKALQDTQAPNCGTINASGTLGNNGWYIGDVTLSASDSSDIISGIKQTTISHHKITSDTSGTKVTLTTTDYAGNSCTKEHTIKKDSTPPNLKSASLANLSIKQWLYKNKPDGTQDILNQDTELISQSCSISTDCRATFCITAGQIGDYDGALVRFEGENYVFEDNMGTFTKETTRRILTPEGIEKDSFSSDYSPNTYERIYTVTDEAGNTLVYKAQYLVGHYGKDSFCSK